MIIYGVSEFQEENPFTVEKQKPYKKYYEKVEKDLLKDIKNLIVKASLDHKTIIIPIIENGEIGLAINVDMSKVRL